MYELVFVFQVLEARQTLHNVLEVGVEDDVFVHVNESRGGRMEDVESIERQALVLIDVLLSRLLLVLSGAGLRTRWRATKQHEYIPDPQLDVKWYRQIK